MLDRWKNAMDSGKLAGALLIDLSKAFECLNHELLIAKLGAYGFDQSSLSYIYSYLSGRKQGTKVYSSLVNGITYYRVSLRDHLRVLYSSTYTSMTYFTLSIKVTLLTILMITLQLNADKFHLLISNHNEDININVGEEVIKCSTSLNYSA